MRHSLRQLSLRGVNWKRPAIAKVTLPMIQVCAASQSQLSTSLWICMSPAKASSAKPVQTAA